MKEPDWNPPPSTPPNPGWWETAVYDAGWIYEWKAYYDGAIWRDQPEGWALQDQRQTWRELTK